MSNKTPLELASMYRKYYGEFLKNARLDKNLDSTQVSNMTGIPLSSITNIEKGTYKAFDGYIGYAIFLNADLPLLNNVDFNIEEVIVTKKASNLAIRMRELIYKYQYLEIERDIIEIRDELLKHYNFKNGVPTTKKISNNLKNWSDNNELVRIIYGKRKFTYIRNKNKK